MTRPRRVDRRFEDPEELYRGLLLHFGDRLFEAEGQATDGEDYPCWLEAGAACGQRDEDDDPPAEGEPFDPRLTEQDHVLPMMARLLEGQAAVRDGRGEEAVAAFLRAVLHVAVLAHPLAPLVDGVLEVLDGQQLRFDLNREVKPPWTRKTPHFLFDRIVAHLLQLTSLVGQDRNDPHKKAELAADAANYLLFYLYRVELLAPITVEDLDERPPEAFEVPIDSGSPASPDGA